jgi:hypothetical protein
MKTEIKNNFEAVLEYLEGLSDSELMGVHNDFCQSINDGDNLIHDNDEDFFEMYFENDVIGAVRAASYGEYNFNDKYVKFNGYANLESFDTVADHVDLDDIANNILESPENYYDISL